jgi:spore coat protein CotH
VRAFWTVLCAAVVFCTALAVSGCGSAPAAASDGASSTSATSVAQSAAPSTEEALDTTTSVPVSLTASEAGAVLFDNTTVHQIAISFVQADYDAMVASYTSSGVKDWIEATVTIDGITFENVGLRLKGNSSIRGLRDGRAGGPGGNVSAAAPESLPWLIRLDKYVEDQNYDGIVDLVIRSNTSSTSLNEAVSLELLDMAGLDSVRSVAVRFSVNGGDAVLRLGTELPDDQWMEQNLAEDGALYKAEAGGDYSYRGTDPAAYDDVFDQEAGKDNADLTPLIGFLDFINSSDDATFASELPERLDIDSFATYLAMEELVGNFDDIDGPGNNSYLYCDTASGMFTLVPWDHNLAFGGFGGGRAEADGATADVAADNRKVHGKSNILVNRFRANADFEALYQQKLAELKASLYTSGDATEVLERWVALLKKDASDLVDSSTIDQEAAKISAYFGA